MLCETQPEKARFWKTKPARLRRDSNTIFAPATYEKVLENDIVLLSKTTLKKINFQFNILKNWILIQSFNISCNTEEFLTNFNSFFKSSLFEAFSCWKNIWKDWNSEWLGQKRLISKPRMLISHKVKVKLLSLFTSVVLTQAAHKMRHTFVYMTLSVFQPSQLPVQCLR